MQTIVVKLPSGSYEIRIGPGLLDNLGAHLHEAGLRDACLIVSQPRIVKVLPANFNAGHYPVALIPDGERAKSSNSLWRLLDVMAEHRLNRQSAVVAVGGGVAGDVAGFAASIYMRGIPVVHVPTTLLAQVDSSIGGKTAVNHRSGKNLIGTFHQPHLVLSDLSPLKTLPDREFASGLYEAIKYGVIRDAALFEQFEDGIDALLRRENDAVEKLVHRCAAIKADVVMADEKEGDLRRILNFGHTIGHGLETAANYRGIRHGEAVGYGMIAATRIAAQMGRLSNQDAERIEAGIRCIGRLPKLPGVRLHAVLDALQHDKKIKDGAIHFILPVAIGQVEVVRDVPISLVHDIVKGILDEAQGIR